MVHSTEQLRDFFRHAAQETQLETGLIVCASSFTCYHGSRKADLRLIDRKPEPTHLSDSALAAVRHITLFESERVPFLYTVTLKQGTALSPQFSREYMDVSDGTVRFVAHLFGLHFKVWNAGRMEIRAGERITPELMIALRGDQPGQIHI